MNRRAFLNSSLIAGTAVLASQSKLFGHDHAGRHPKFGLGYAPNPGTFRNLAGADVIDCIKFAADQGFTAWEDNGMKGRSPREQEAIGQTLADLHMQMGVFVAYANFDQPTFAQGNPDDAEKVLASIRESVAVAERCGATWMTVVPGSVDQQSARDDGDWNQWGGRRLAEGYQFANVIDLLRRCSEVLEPHGLVMVLEPLNWHANHGGVWLEHSDQAYAVCRAVNSPSCKILFDIYHQQIAEGNLIPNIDMCWDEIAYFQCGDNPGRKEPGTGEINYRKVFDHLKSKDFTGVVGMEHGKSQDGAAGEQAVIDAYRQADGTA
jgi:hydroxypyruvate isomerase